MRKEATLEAYLDEVRRNKKLRVDTGDFSIIRNDKVYPALFTDAWHDKEKNEIKVDAIVFASPKGTKREFKYRTNSAALVHYEELCDTLGTNGNPCELIGKAAYLHFERNGDFQNVRIDERISRSELREAIAEMEDDVEERPRKKDKAERSVKVKRQKSCKQRYPHREEDDFDEAEESEDDFDEDTEDDLYSDMDDDFSDFE